MALPSQLQSLLAHPAPGILFGAHERAGIPERIRPTRHAAKPPARPADLEELRAALAHAPEVLAQWLPFHQACDGFELCILPDSMNGVEEPALSLLSIQDSEAITRTYEPEGEMAWLTEEIPDLYTPGNFRIIASSPSEGTTLTLGLQGELDGKPLAGRIFYLAMDPVCDFDLFPSLTALLDAMSSDPGALIKDLGYCAAAVGASGIYGDPPERYFPDIRNDPRVVHD